jgi:aminoglycoside phosphotransferase (APT) family kinase protein
MLLLPEDNTTSIRAGEELNISILNDFLAKNAPNIGEIQSVRQFAGGYSNLTYQLKTEKGTFVLRRPPFGAAHIKGAHDMGREYRVLSALDAAGYRKIPKMMVYDASNDVLGVPFYVMESVSGVILRAKDAKKIVAALPPTQIRDISIGLAESLVELHSLEMEKSGLMQLGKPEGYVRRQVEGWIKRYAVAVTDDLPDMNFLAEWLLKNMPPDGAPAFLHNDYKYDNVILHPEKLSEVRAILDWEMSTVGDAMMDVGATLAYWFEAPDSDSIKQFNLTALAGNINREEFIQLYAQKSGRDVSNIVYYFAFGTYKNAVILQQIYKRYKDGFSKDHRFAQLWLPIKEFASMGRLAVVRNQLSF